MANLLLLKNEKVNYKVLGPPFYFMTAIGEYTGEAAVSLLDFLVKLKIVDPHALTFHLHRRDFQKWINDRWHLDPLVQDLDLIREKGFEGECLRQQLINVVAIHLA